MNVRTLSILLTALLISGCSSFGWKSSVKPIEVQSVAVERTPLNIPDPTPIKSNPPTWFIITPDNADQVWQRLREQNADVVLFALTDEGYEQLAVSIAEIRNFIAQQREIIIKYKQYYEPQK